MSTHNICFHGEIRKISAFSDEKSALFVAMLQHGEEMGCLNWGKKGKHGG